MKTKKFKLVSIAIALMIVLNLGMGVWAFDLLTPTAQVDETLCSCCLSGEIEELEPEMAMRSGHTHTTTCYFSFWGDALCKPPFYPATKCTAGYEYCEGHFHIVKVWMTQLVCGY